MYDDRPFLILFPGAWGNKTNRLATWWFRHVIDHFKRDYNVVLLTYEGLNLEDYVDSVVAQLEKVPDGSYAICYSMGAQIARGVAEKRPSLFRRVALLSGVERFGIRFSVLLHAMSFALIPLIRTLFLRPFMLDTVKQVSRTFLHDDSPTSLMWAQGIWERQMKPEPPRVVLSLCLPGLRRTFPPFSCPVMAIVPRQDIFLMHATYPGEEIQRITAPGGHALIAGNYSQLRPYLTQILRWFHH